ncbi:hypothetical protein Tco_1039235, partial [Tanacetum coccineum]
VAFRHLRDAFSVVFGLSLTQDTVMSDSKDSTVTYTAVSSPFSDLLDIGSPRVDGPLVMPEDPYAYVVAAFQAPPSPDYVPGPEYPPSLEFVLEPVYPEFMPPEDGILPAEEQPLPADVLPAAVSPAAVSPTADSPGYVPESDPEEDLEEDDDEDPEEDPVDYPADRGDDGDDEDDSSDDDEDKDVDIEGDEEEEEEEHPAPADSTAVALPAVDQAPSAEETEPFETDESAATPPPHPAYRVTARISISDKTPISLPPREEIPSPPLPPILLPLPVSPPLPQIPSPPLPISSPVPVLSPSPPASPIRSLRYRAAMIRLRAEAASTSHSLPLPPPIILSHTRPDAPSSGTPPLHLLSTDRRADRPEVTLPPRKRLGIALGPRYEVRESSSVAARPPRGFRVDYGFVATIDREIMRDLERDVGYGIIDTWDEIPIDMLGASVTNDTELGRWMTKFTTRVRQDINEIYTRLDDEQSERQLMASLLNMLYRDRRAHARTARLMETEAKITAGSDYRATGSRPQETDGDYKDAGGRPHETEAVHRGTEAAEETSDSDDRVRETAGTRQRVISSSKLPIGQDHKERITGYAPPSPDYIPGPEEPQPLSAINSPSADSLGYIPESYPEEDPEEDKDEDPKEDHADYPADGGDDGDDEDELSDDDKDEDVDIKADDDEEEEHPAPADSTAVALPVVDQALSAEETEPFETNESTATLPPHPAYRVTARISIRDETPISLPPREDIPSPPLPPILSPLPVSPPLPQISSPPLPVSSPVPVLSPSPPASPIRPLGYRAAMIRLRAEAASTSHSLPLPPPIILSHTRPDAPSSGTPPLNLRKRLGITLGSRYEVGESSSAAARPTRGLRADYGFAATMDREIRRDLERDVGYGITDSWDEIVEAMQGTPVVTYVAEFSQRMTEFETKVRQDTYEIYTRLDDEQSKRQLMAGWLNMLYRDRQVMSLRTQVVAQQAVITKLQIADRRRQAVITGMLAVDRRRWKQFIEALKLLKRLQTQMTEFKRQQGLAKGPA